MPDHPKDEPADEAERKVPGSSAPGGPGGVASGLQPGGTAPGGGPGASEGSIGTGGGSTGGAPSGNRKNGGR
jgi:hypothetical protein